jgi:hypothetical protein
MSNFYNFYLENNRIKDIKNQQELVGSAKLIKLFLEKKINKLPKKHKWLFDKLQKNITNHFRGQLVNKDILGIIEEILDPTNSSAKMHWSKSPRKQGVENIQKNYLKSTYGIDLTLLSKSGKESIKFNSITGELVSGINRKQNYTKTLDGKISNLSVDNYTFQKVTTDDGGSTNSVEDEVFSTINSALLNQEYYIIFILDGPYWDRNSSECKSKKRFEVIYEKSTDRVIICSSDTLTSELSKRNINIKEEE